MKISEVQNFSVSFRVETPTDAQMYVSKSTDVRRFIAQYGDLEIIRDCWDLGLFHVPAFKERIEAYTKMKAAHCARYGSN